MAILPSASVKTAIMTTLRDSVADGTLEILSSSNQVLAVFELASSGGTVSGLVWTLEFVSESVLGTAAAGTGTNATKARMKDSSGNVDIDGITVGLPETPAALKLINTSITEGQTVELTSAVVEYQ